MSLKEGSSGVCSPVTMALLVRLKVRGISVSGASHRGTMPSSSEPVVVLETELDTWTCSEQARVLQHARHANIAAA